MLQGVKAQKIIPCYGWVQISNVTLDLQGGNPTCFSLFAFLPLETLDSISPWVFFFLYWKDQTSELSWYFQVLQKALSEEGTQSNSHLEGFI